MRKSASIGFHLLFEKSPPFATAVSKMKRHRTLLVSEYLKPRRRGRPRKAKPVAPPVPRAFDFGFTARRPLVPLAAVTMFLDKSAREVLALIEQGELRWAFDIRSSKAERREVRVLRQSLFEFTGLYSPPENPSGGEGEFAKIIGLILPKGTIPSPGGASGAGFRLKMRLPAAEFRKLRFPREPVLRATEIAQSFSCLGQHVHNLIREKSLQAANLRCGPKASPLVTRASVVEFLKQRRMS